MKRPVSRKVCKTPRNVCKKSPRKHYDKSKMYYKITHKKAGADWKMLESPCFYSPLKKREFQSQRVRGLRGKFKKQKCKK